MGVENNIPEGWVEVNIAEIATTNDESIGRDYNHLNIEYLDTGSITKNSIEGFQLFDLKEAPSRAKRLVKNGDIIYSTVRPNQEHYGYINNPKANCVVSTGFCVIRSKDTCCSKFLYYLLTQNKVRDYLHLLGEQSASAYPSIKPIDIENLTINIPGEFNEQKAIAKVLTAFDEKIELLQAQNKTLETMTQTIFKEWFGKYQVGDELPEGWRVGEFGELFNLTMGLSPKGDSYNHDMIGIPLLNGAGDYTGEKLDPKRYTSKPTRINKVGDLVFCIRGTIGKIVFADKEYCLGRGVAALSPKESNDKYFNYIKLKRIIDELTRNATGSVILGLSKDDIKKAELVLPSRIKLNEFSEVVRPLFSKIENNQNQIQSLTKTRDTLLPKLMSGQIRVNNLKQTADA